jgi:hypothetical protein
MVAGILYYCDDVLDFENHDVWCDGEEESVRVLVLNKTKSILYFFNKKNIINKLQ